MKKLIIILATVSICIAYIGIKPTQNTPPPPPKPHISNDPVTTAGIERFTFPIGQSTIILYKIDQTKYDFHLQTSSEKPKTVIDWKTENPTASLIVNAAYFHEDFSPSGWMIQNGTRIGTRQFDTDKSGVLTLSPTISLTQPTQLPTSTQTEDAFQSYPFLLKNKKPTVTSDSGKLARRTFFGIDENNTSVYIGIIPTDEVSLFELANTLSTLPLNITTTINLDGGPSSGLISSEDSWNSFTPVPSVIVVTPK